jgi:hypothetical protein
MLSAVLKLSDSSFEIGRIIQILRTRCSDGEFGYRMQAIFAHILLRQGWHIIEINAQGHPDIRASMADQEALVQVKSVVHRTASSTIKLSEEDVAGITALGRRPGWFAILDCAAPARWNVVSSNRAARLLGKPIYVTTLRANSDVAMTADCNNQFREIISANSSRLSNLSYAILRKRALAHEGL